MAAFSEIQIRKRLVQGWMDRVPSLTITLHRPIITTTAAGGTEALTEQVLQPQQFGFMPFKRRLTIEKSRDSQTLGQNESTDIYYVLIGVEGKIDILKGDYFDKVGDQFLEQGRYYVDFVQSRSHDHLQAGIRYRGRGVG